MAHLNRDALVDKLCERLAVETGGVDIYKAVIDKMDDADITTRLQRFMRDEAQHCELLARYLDSLGVATRETPSARLARLEGEAYL
jgi:rubrerythrin